jgi:hypothetical protein
MIDSIILHNYNLPNQQLELNDMLYPINNFTTEVDVRFNEQVKPSEHGIWIRNTFYGKRLFHMEGEILADSSGEYIEARRALLSILTPRSRKNPRTPVGWMDIWFTGMPEKVTTDFTVESYPELPMEALAPSVGRFQLNLKSFDPRLYGEESNQTAHAPGTTGRNYAKTYDKTYVSGSISEDDIIILNSGEIEVYPIVDFYGPCTGPRAILRDPSGSLTTFELPNLVLTSTDIVRADFDKKTIMNVVTGADDYSYKSGEWWALEPGQNTVRASAFSPGIGSKTVFKWRNGYLI